MTYASLSTEGYGHDGSITLVARQGYSTGSGTTAALSTGGYGIGGSIAAICRDGYCAYPNLAATPPAGKQYKDVAGLPWPVGSDSWLASASPAAVNGDIQIVDLVVSPDGDTLIPFGDGTFEALMNTDASRQSFMANLFRIGTRTADTATIQYFNNHKPQQTGSIPVQLLNVTVAMTPLDLSLYNSDFEGDARTYSVSPASTNVLSDVGLALVGSVVSGTPPRVGNYSITFRVTDITGDYTDLAAVIFQVSMPGSFSTVPSLLGLSQSAAVAALSAASLMAVITFQTSTSTPGTVLTQSPAAGLSVASGSSVAITIAAAAMTVPSLVGLTQAVAQAAVIAAGFGFVVAPQLNGGIVGTVASQAPAAGTVAAPNSVVSINVAVVAMPNLIGLSFAQATALANASGILLNSPFAPSPAVVVTTQSVAPGVLLYSLLTPVTITLSSLNPVGNFDLENYIGPPSSAATYQPNYPLWMYHPILAPQIVISAVAQEALVASDPEWTTQDPFPTD